MSDETKSEMPVVLVIEEDLFFSVRIETALTKMGYRPIVISDHTRVLEQASAHSPILAIVNFASERLAPADTVRHLKELPNPFPVMGFCPHVRMPQIRPNAIAAGCDLLVANSALTMRLPQLVTKILSRKTHGDSPDPTEDEEVDQ